MADATDGRDIFKLIFLLFCAVTSVITLIVCLVGFPILLFMSEHYVLGTLVISGELSMFCCVLMGLFAAVR